MFRYNTGLVYDWGPANSVSVIQYADGVMRVPSWHILFVNVYIRNESAGAGRTEDRGWMWRCSFCTTGWHEVPTIFDEYYGSAGVYTRVAFFVEIWVWTYQNGWEALDYL